MVSMNQMTFRNNRNTFLHDKPRTFRSHHTAESIFKRMSSHTSLHGFRNIFFIHVSDSWPFYHLRNVSGGLLRDACTAVLIDEGVQHVRFGIFSEIEPFSM